MSTDNHIMVAISHIAERDDVSKQAVSKTVKRLLDDRPDTPVERGSQGQVLRISLAHYDHYRQRFVNPAKASAPIRPIVSAPLLDDVPPLVPSQEDSFDEARRQSEWLKVGREKLRQQEESGRLLRKDKIDEAHRVISAELQSIIKRLPNRADAVAEAVSKEGIHGARVLLRQIAFELGNQLADKLAQIAQSAPTEDPLIEESDA